MSRAHALQVLRGAASLPASYSAADFEADLGDVENKQAQRRAAELTGAVAGAEPKHLPVIATILDGRGVGARWLREWKADVRAQRKHDGHSEPEAAAEGEAPLREKKGGALHAALGERLRQAVEAFAIDPGKGLYRYDASRGHYVGPCESWVQASVRRVLRDEDALDLFSQRRVDAVVYDLVTTAAPLDREPPRGHLVLRNGVLNLATGTLEPHRPDQWRTTYGLPIAFDPDADPSAPAWSAYFDALLPDDAGGAWGFELVRWLMTPASGKRPALLLYGPGDDGKSTLLRLLRTVLGGDDGAAVSAASLHALTSDRFALADLYGTVLNVCADLPNEPLAASAVGRFKEVTGGDSVRAERKYGQGFTFAPFAHLVFSTNHPIQVKTASDPAFWSRWVAVPFDGGRLHKRPEAEIRAELLTPRALSDLLAAALACGDADGRPPEPTASMRACLEWMRSGIGTRTQAPSQNAAEGDGALSEPIAPTEPHNFPQTDQTGHTPPVSRSDDAWKVVGEVLPPWDDAT